MKWCSITRDSIVVITKSPKEWAQECINIFHKITTCVMETKAEFCHSIKPRLFLLKCTEGTDYLSEDNMFAVSEIEKALQQGRM